MHPSARILIVRLTAMGDVIHGLPVASALRAEFPDSMLAWAVEGRASDLIEGHPDLDTVIRLPRHWWRSLAAIRGVRRQLRQLNFDTTVDLQCLTKSALVAWLSGAPRRLGVAGANGRELSKWFNNELTDVRAEHVVEHYLQILRPLGIESPQVQFKLPERADERLFAEESLARLALSTAPFAVLNPGAGWPSKVWPAERYGQVARQLLAKHGVPSLCVWCGGDERSLAERIVNASDGAARLAPSTSMTQLAALLRRAALFVGSDTGPMHLSVAVGTPTVSLHGTSRAEWCGAYGESNATVQKYYHSGTARERRNADNVAMRAISVEEVLAACDQMVQRTNFAHAS